MGALSAGHLATDFASGAVPALVPFFVAEWDLSYALAGLVVLGWAVSSSVVQPVFGLVSDRRGALWLLPFGVALSGIGIGLAAIAPGYWAALALIVVAGLGTAAYHPEGSKYAAYVSGDRRATGMSLFSIGGNVGFALGPLAVTALVVSLGLDGGRAARSAPLPSRERWRRSCRISTGSRPLGPLLRRGRGRGLRRAGTAARDHRRAQRRLVRAAGLRPALEGRAGPKRGVREPRPRVRAPRPAGSGRWPPVPPRTGSGSGPC